jgi:hypothetical protein
MRRRSIAVRPSGTSTTLNGLVSESDAVTNVRTAREGMSVRHFSILWGRRAQLVERWEVVRSR